MQKGSPGVWQVVLVLLALGTLAGLFGAGKRVSVEARNKSVEIGLEYEEVSRLAQVSQQPIEIVLQKFQGSGRHVHHCQRRFAGVLGTDRAGSRHANYAAERRVLHLRSAGYARNAGSNPRSTGGS